MGSWNKTIIHTRQFREWCWGISICSFIIRFHHPLRPKITRSVQSKTLSTVHKIKCWDASCMGPCMTEHAIRGWSMIEIILIKNTWHEKHAPSTELIFLSQMLEHKEMVLIWKYSIKKCSCTATIIFMPTSWQVTCYKSSRHLSALNWQG